MIDSTNEFAARISQIEENLSFYWILGGNGWKILKLGASNL